MKAINKNIAMQKAKAERMIAKAFEDEYAGRITTQQRNQIEKKYSPILNK